MLFLYFVLYGCNLAAAACEAAAAVSTQCPALTTWSSLTKVPEQM
jgi:hypothetical protein